MEGEEALLAQINEAYFGPGDPVLHDADELAAVVRAHAEDHEEDGEPDRVIVLRIAAGQLDIFGDGSEPDEERMEAGRRARALIKLYRQAQDASQ